MEIKRITTENAGDLALRNEPFVMPGRFVPGLVDGIWSYRIEPFETAQTMTFPDERYDFEMLSKDGVAFGAYEDGVCIGIAVYRDAFWDYMYLHDLKVCGTARGKGVGRALIDAGKQEARDRGYRGLYLHAQDSNLNACLFYLKVGFEIGGFDNHMYRGTSQEGKADIIFYTK